MAPNGQHSTYVQADDLDACVDLFGRLKRRDFLKFCTGVAVTLGLSPALGARIAKAATSPARPTVFWLSGQACTGCTETLLRSHHPTVDTLILDMISLDYHETLAAGSGEQAEIFKDQSMKRNWGEYVLVVDGSIPTKDGGIYCQVAGHPFVDDVRHAAEGAAAIIAMGSCSAWGGIPSADPNPTEAKSAQDVLPGKTVINIPGCPPSPYNFLSTVLYLLTFGKPPELDAQNRPRFAYGRLIHENCERRPHFDAGRFALEFGDAGHRQGWCLYKLGCKGPETYANCPAIGFNDAGFGAWPVGTGHPCFGCTEKGIGFTKPMHAMAEVLTVTPPNLFPRVAEPKGQGVTPAAAALAAGVVGLGVGAGAVLTSRLGKDVPPDEAAFEPPHYTEKPDNQ
ncbi:MAG: twin-arginine translocation signal domain-containing protein [Rhodospirillales bacterium]|nr:MAG: twin-arginine translocation signal domain-containing protein [Rhodospirillales bacterium]TVR98465.1 MAG: twin-arginine translocation signal domain-containing protein [Rhodospirillales bacterium]